LHLNILDYIRGFAMNKYFNEMGQEVTAYVEGLKDQNELLKTANISNDSALEKYVKELEAQLKTVSAENAKFAKALKAKPK